MYAIATRLVGFRSDTLRVNVTRREGRYVWCTTADIQDAGTPLILDVSQVRDMPEAGGMVWHRDGLVVFG